MRVDDALVELASGIDALYLSGRAALPGDLLDRLAECRLEAELAASPVQIDLGGSEFVVSPRGLGKYAYCLTHRNGVVAITPSDRLPALRVQPRAEFLHGVGATNAVEWFRSALEAACGHVAWSVSRLDLHADFQGWQLDWADRERFVCRADALAIHGERGEVTGWRFGLRKTKTICARIYDKTREIERKGLDYWQDIWGDRYEVGRPVLRIEVEFGRIGLNEFRVDTPDEVISSAGGLWMSATHNWLTYRRPSPDRTRSRWPVASEWAQIQHASIADGAHAIDRVREGLRRGNLRKIAPALVGYASTFAAIVGTEGVDDTCALLPTLIRTYGCWSGRPFAERVLDKRRSLGL